MFTGLIEGVGRVKTATRVHADMRLTVAPPFDVTECRIGDSICVDGVCVTVTGIQDGSFSADVLVSNPPYIADPVIETLPRDVREHEPRMALSGGPDGLDFYRHLAHSMPRCLRRGGAAVLEVGYDQADDVSRILADEGLKIEEAVKDLAGVDRVVVGRA